MRIFWFASGLVSVALGVIGIFLPILPTVPFLILAAFCFSRSHKQWEARLLEHPVYGPPIRNWREKGVVSRRGKIAATLAFAFSIALGFFTIKGLWVWLPPAVAAICLSWLWTRPEG